MNMKKRMFVLTMALCLLAVTGCNNDRKDESMGKEEKETVKQEFQQDEKESGKDTENTDHTDEIEETDTGETIRSDEDYFEPAGMSKDEYRSMTAEDLLEEIIPDIQNITVEQCVQLYSTYAYAEVAENEVFEDSITSEACGQIYEQGGKLPYEEAMEELLASPSEKVRAKAYAEMESVLGVDEKYIQMAMEELKTEEEPLVLVHALNVLHNAGKNNEEAQEFFFRMSEHDNARVRLASIRPLVHSCGEKATDTIITLMSDTDQEVAARACEYAGDLYDEKVVEPLQAILNDAEKFNLHGNCMVSLHRLWQDFPAYEHTSEKAYQAAMEYVKKTPRTENVPYWAAVSEMYPKTEPNEKYEAWKEKATYLNPSEIVAVMMDLIQDTDANWMARMEGIKAVKAYGNDEEIEEMTQTVLGLSDDKAMFLQKQVQ